jgi:acyl-CoA reductase-like NAD-dependent aldehyde dehydrogenase
MERLSMDRLSSEDDVASGREFVERELREALEEAERAWKLAPPSKRAAALEKFQEALKEFREFVESR